MLDIPQEVKNLFHRDGVYKNIRITFDDPELPEITNENIVAGSFSFRESVSSADSVTFGACEASSLEFETVGVQNILGKWFSAYIEVDASTLPAELQQIRADLNVPIYPVPIGSFIVTSCPRNKGAMAHRRVSSVSFIDAGYRPISGEIVDACRHVFQVAKKESTVMQTSLYRIWAYYGVFPDSMYTNSIVQNLTPTNAHGIDYGRVRINGQAVYGRNGLTGVSTMWQITGVLVDDKVVSCNSEYLDLYQVAESFANSYGSMIYGESRDGVFYDLGREQIPVSLQELKDAIKQSVVDYFSGRKPGVQAGIVGNYTGTGLRDIAQLASRSKGVKCIAPFTFVNRSGSVFEAKAPVLIPYGLRSVPGHTSQVVRQLADGVYVSYRTHTINDLPTVITDSITVQAVPTYTVDQKTYFCFDSCLEELKKIFAGAMELAGVFASGVRSGDNAAAYFDDTPVERLQRGDYSECWYDDYNFEPVGTIAYKLNGQDRVYTFGPGQSVYTFANNDIFSYFKNCTEAKAQALFDALLIPALAKLKYTPVDLDARGLPYLQAGDCIEIETEDGEIIKTYILTRELSGEQHMVDRIEAPGVNVLEVIT